jgi:hypothetical protein
VHHWTRGVERLEQRVEDVGEEGSAALCVGGAQLEDAAIDAA